MMNILITGSKGVVGSWLTKKLSANNNVFGVDLIHADGESGFTKSMGVHDNYARCDIGNFRQLQRILDKRFDLVYNCAAEFGRWNGEDYYEQLWHSNVVGLKNLLLLRKDYGFKLVHFSSSEVYGDYDSVMAEEVMNTVPIKQLNDYAISKWVNELQILNSENPAVIVRLFNTYGPGEFYHPYRSVNCKFCYHALKGLPVTVFRGHQRTSTYIEDCVNALTLFSEKYIPGVYNIAGDHLHSIEELVDIIWANTGVSRNLISYSDSEPQTTTKKLVDNSKIKDLGFKETVTLDEGVKNTINWMRQYYGI